MKSTTAFIILSLTLWASFVWAHGEDKPGPHGGLIRMPGAFHIEVVQEKNAYRIYLLDLNWQNPSVLDSSVEASILDGKNKTKLQCNKESDSYFCNTKQAQKGELIVVAKREGQVGAAASLALPLKIEAKKSEHQHHSM